MPRRKTYRKAHWWSIKARRVDLSSGERYASNDWLTNFLSMPRSHVLERIGSHLWGQIAICTAVVFLDKAGFHFPRKSSLPHQLLGGVLALLLAFRTNMAYSRFGSRARVGHFELVVRDLALYVVARAPAEPELAIARRAHRRLPARAGAPLLGRRVGELPPGVAAIPQIRSPGAAGEAGLHRRNDAAGGAGDLPRPASSSPRWRGATRGGCRRSSAGGGRC